jgi:hypothetical protein
VHVAREPVVLGIGGKSEGLPELPAHQLAPGSQLAHLQPRKYQSIKAKKVNRSINQSDRRKTEIKTNCADFRLKSDPHANMLLIRIQIQVILTSTQFEKHDASLE